MLHDLTYCLTHVIRICLKITLGVGAIHALTRVGACLVQIPTLATAGLTIQEHIVKVNIYFIATCMLYFTNSVTSYYNTK